MASIQERVVMVRVRYVICKESLTSIVCATNLHSFNLLSFLGNVIDTDLIGDN